MLKEQLHITSHTGHVLFVILAFLVGGLTGIGVGVSTERSNNIENNAYTDAAAGAKVVKATTSPTASPKATATATANPTAAATATPVAGQLTYINTKYNYSIKYPSSGWKIYNESGIGDNLATASTANFERNSDSDRSYYIEVSSTPIQTKTDSFTATANLAGNTNYLKQSITFAGQSATQITYTDSSTGAVKIIIFVKNNLTYVINGGSTLDQVLSTFQLTQ